MNKLRLYVIALLSCAAAATSAATVVRVTDGEALSAEFLLADSPEVSYVDGALTVKAGDVVVAYPADKTYTFTISEATGLKDALTTRVEISADGNTVTFAGLEASETVRLYDTAGRMLAASDADAEGAVTLSLGDYHGVVIISLKNQSFKLIK